MKKNELGLVKKCYLQNVFAIHMYSMYMYKNNLALNKVQGFISHKTKPNHCQVGWGCRIHRLLLCRRVRPHSKSVQDMTLNNLMVRFQQWGMQSTPSLPSLPRPLWPGVVAPDKDPIYGLNRTKQWLEFTVFIHFKLDIYAKLNCLK